MDKEITEAMPINLLGYPMGMNRKFLWILTRFHVKVAKILSENRLMRL